MHTVRKPDCDITDFEGQCICNKQQGKDPMFDPNGDFLKCQKCVCEAKDGYEPVYEYYNDDFLKCEVPDDEDKCVCKNPDGVQFGFSPIYDDDNDFISCIDEGFGIPTEDCQNGKAKNKEGECKTAFWNHGARGQSITWKNIIMNNYEIEL